MSEQGVPRGSLQARALSLLMSATHVKHLGFRSFRNTLRCPEAGERPRAHLQVLVASLATSGRNISFQAR